MHRSQPVRPAFVGALELKNPKIPIENCYSTFQKLIGGSIHDSS